MRISKICHKLKMVVKGRGAGDTDVYTGVTTTM